MNTESGEHMDVNEEKKNYWEEEWDLIRPFFEDPADLSHIEHLSEAFRPSDGILRCIDERTPGGVHCAGAGILLGDRAIEVIRKMNISGVTSHESCGAAKMAADRAGVSPDKVEDFAKEWAVNLAERLHVPYRGHLSVEPHFHNARVAYYDGTGRFDPMKCPGLPTGFVISRKYLPRDYAVSEMEVASGIALGDHGYGTMFTKARGTQFIIMVIGDSRDAECSHRNLTNEVWRLGQKSDGRVIVRGFDAPAEPD